MSSNRLPYDTCAYKQQLAESIGVGVYQLGKPNNSCEPCYADDPRIMLQSQGVSISKHNLVDVDSELMGITRNASRCPERQYMPACDADGLCGASGGVNAKCAVGAKLCVSHQKNPIKYENCFKGSRDTRLDNPPSTLRCTGWNRWEWLPLNPQDKVEIPFDFQIDTKLIAKDNHRPCIRFPMDQSQALPPQNNSTEIFYPVNNYTHEPSITWQSIRNISNL